MSEVAGLKPGRGGSSEQVTPGRCAPGRGGTLKSVLADRPGAELSRCTALISQRRGCFRGYARCWHLA